VASPVRSKSHGQPHGRPTWLVFTKHYPGVDLNDNATVRLDLDNEPQPDALLRIEVGGSRIRMMMTTLKAHQNSSQRLQLAVLLMTYMTSEPIGAMVCRNI